MYGRVIGMTIVGVRGHPVAVEAHIGRGLPSLTLTGLPGPPVQDARDRIRPAVESSGLEWPLRRIVVNLSPGNLRKDGPGLDLPIAMSVLTASAQVPGDRLSRVSFFGELSLKGGLVATPGVLSVAIAAARAGMDAVVVPAANAGEAALVEGVHVVGARGLGEVAGFLRGVWDPSPPSPSEAPEATRHGVDFAEVRGQAQARRALEVAAAGGHNVLLVGSPGAGKTMLARRLATILPGLSRDEALEVTQLHSVAGMLDGGLVRSRPFRSPHHSISLSALLGGGTGFVRPGEVSLAHHGVLFLDELTEFRRDAVEALRQPLEDGRVVVTRVAGSVEFPAGSRSSRPPTRVRAATRAIPNVSAGVPRTVSSCIARSCRDPSSIASTSGSWCLACPRESCWARPSASRHPPSGVASRRHELVKGTATRPSASRAMPCFPGRWPADKPGCPPADTTSCRQRWIRWASPAEGSIEPSRWPGPSPTSQGPSRSAPTTWPKR